MGLFNKKPTPPHEQPQAAYFFPILREPCGYCGGEHNGGCSLGVHEASKELMRAQKRVGKKPTGRP